MKRIALFISSLQKGGSERVMVNLAEYFHAKGYEVILVTQYKREVEYDISPEIRRVYSEPREEELQGGRIHNFIARYNALRDIWKAYKPDVILSFIGKNNQMALLTSLFLPVKVAVSVRADPYMEYPGKANRLFTNILFRKADGVILQTKLAKVFFPKAIRKKSQILANPLNPVFINNRYTGPRQDIVVAAGRLDDNKNHRMLINAFSMIADEFPGMKLVIYGEGELRQELEQLIMDKKLEGKVLLPGSVSDLSERIKAARVFTLTSNTEGMPNSLMEAMALGIPVISTDCPCGGPAELIRDGENGILFNVGDCYALADALRSVLSDEGFAQKLSDKGYESSLNYLPDKVNKEWEEYLNSL